MPLVVRIYLRESAGPEGSARTPPLCVLGKGPLALGPHRTNCRLHPATGCVCGTAFTSLGRALVPSLLRTGRPSPDPLPPTCSLPLTVRPAPDSPCAQSASAPSSSAPSPASTEQRRETPQGAVASVLPPACRLPSPAAPSAAAPSPTLSMCPPQPVECVRPRAGPQSACLTVHGAR